jgi:hypothetical protein
VSCVTPVRRVAARDVTTTAGLAPERAGRWARAFTERGASQCGFCTPGIVLRLAALEDRAASGRAVDEAAVRTALLAHLCRCTGWQSVVEAACDVLGVPCGTAGPRPGARSPLLVQWRAELEGGTPQVSDEAVVLGRAGFADDTAPAGARVALGHGPAAPDLARARARAGKVQGRRSTAPLSHPVALPDGAFALTLRSTWVEPAYLEPDASWCRPGGTPASPLANGGAFGGKRHSPVAARAAALAEETGAPVRVLWPRETVTAEGPKRPPVALGLRADGTGVLRLGVGPGSDDLGPLCQAVAVVAPGVVVEQVPVTGPPVSADLRGAGWAEVAAARAVLARPDGPFEVRAPGGGRATVALRPDGTVAAEVWAGEVLDEVTLRSYCLGAVHQALGLVRQEGVAVDAEGRVLDLTIRSFGVLTARDTPGVDVTVHPMDTFPVNGSEAVFAATLAAAWAAAGIPPTWPVSR